MRAGLLLLLVLACGSPEEPAVPATCHGYAGPRGASEGEILASLQLFRCDGAAVDLDALACDARRQLVTDYCGWCPISIVHTAYISESARLLGSSGLGVVVVVASGLNGSFPTAALCDTVADRLGPDVTVLFDPYGGWREAVSSESDTWLLLEPSEPDTAAHRIVARATKPELSVWLHSALPELRDVVLPTPQQVAAPLLAEPLCHDLFALGVGSLSSSFDSMPHPELGSVGDRFCACAVAGREEAFMDAWIESDAFSSVFDGLEHGAESFHETLDYPTVRDSLLATCAAELDLAPLEAALFGELPMDQVTCTDEDGDDPTRAKRATGRRFSVDLLLSLAFDRDRGEAFDVVEQLMSTNKLYDPPADAVLQVDDRCMDSMRLREARCIDGLLTVSYTACDGTCESGRCQGGSL